MILVGKERDIPRDLKDHCLCDHASGSYWGNHGAGQHASGHWSDRVPDLLFSNGGGSVLHKKSKKILSPAFHWVGAVGTSF